MRIEIGYYSPAVTTTARQMVPNVSATSVTSALTPMFAITASAGTSTTQAQPFIFLMSGGVPTDISTWTTQGNVYSTGGQILVWFGTATSENSLATSPPGTVASIDTAYKTAIASGVATWFMFGMKKSDPGDYNTSVIYQAVVGSVGLIGSGADLEVASTNVVTGSTYRISNLKINFPLVFDY